MARSNQLSRALFALRNLDTAEAVEAIVAGFNDPSALFRHEIAYVLGQMQHPAAVEGCKKQLLDNEENEMVRHECAEALGSIATEEVYYNLIRASLLMCVPVSACTQGLLGR